MRHQAHSAHTPLPKDIPRTILDAIPAYLSQHCRAPRNCRCALRPTAYRLPLTSYCVPQATRPSSQPVTLPVTNVLVVDHQRPGNSHIGHFEYRERARVVPLAHSGGCGLAVENRGRLSAQRRDNGSHDDGQRRATVLSTPSRVATTSSNGRWTSYGWTSSTRCSAIAGHATARLSHGRWSLRPWCAASEPAGRNDGRRNASWNEWPWRPKCDCLTALKPRLNVPAAAATTTADGMYVDTLLCYAASFFYVSPPRLTMLRSCQSPADAHGATTTITAAEPGAAAATTAADGTTNGAAAAV